MILKIYIIYFDPRILRISKKDLDNLKTIVSDKKFRLKDLFSYGNFSDEQYEYINSHLDSNLEFALDLYKNVTFSNDQNMSEKEKHQLMLPVFEESSTSQIKTRRGVEGALTRIKENIQKIFRGDI